MSEIICETRGAVGLVTLNRPSALNAITHGMVRDLARALDLWEHDPKIACVVATAAGERAFSAGGDIRALYEAAREGRYAEALDFWRDEYRLNIRIKRFPKPYVAIVDGMVMGGGVGVSLHGRYRVAGDRYRFAMPEVGIGFFPDVGATYALPRLPGHAGWYLALTGERVGADEAATLGLATHLVASADVPALLARLVAGEDVERALGALARPHLPGAIAEQAEMIDRCFSADTLPGIFERLDAEASAGSAAAGKIAATMRAKSPMSLAITFEQMRRGADLTFEDAMALEFRIVSRVVRGHEFQEGVRAAIIDKDGRPNWRPATLAQVDPAAVAAHFASLGDDEFRALR